MTEPVEVSETRDEVGLLTSSLQKTIQVLCSYIKNISEMLSNLDKGNMNVSIELDYIEDFTARKESLLCTVETFNAALVEINGRAEQTESISQLTLGVDQISLVVQTNSAISEQSAASSEELAKQAESGLWAST